MSDINLKKLSDQLVLNLKGLQNRRMTLIVSSSSELNENVILTILGNSVLEFKATKYFSSFSNNFNELENITKKEKAMNGLDILAIGDIQFFPVEDNISNYEHMSNLSSHFKNLAKELKCHVIIGMSIPFFSNELMNFSRLKEIGQLDKEADAILFVDCDSEKKIKVSIEKNRIISSSKTSLATKRD